MSFCFFKKNIHTTKGFTLIELLVVLAIISILLGVAVFDYVGQRDNANLQAGVEGFVATLRQAQSYATAVREHDGSFDIGYGVRVEEGEEDINIVVDADKNGSLSGEDLISTFTLSGGVRISGISASQGSPQKVDIVFIRPAVAPILKRYAGPIAHDIDEVRITIESPEGKTRTVIINTTGQISVE